MARKQSKTASNVEPNLTLADLTRRYAEQMEKQGKSPGTCFSYLMELRLAQSELGEETLVSALTPERIAEFNTSKRVVKLKSGKPKSQLSIDKTRRVLRLALAWAHAEGLVAEPIIDPKRDALPGQQQSDVTVVVGDTVVNDPTPTKKPRGRKRAITLEVAQPEGEAAADVAEAAVAATNESEPTAA